MRLARAGAVSLVVTVVAAEWVILRQWREPSSVGLAEPTATFENATLLSWRGSRERLRGVSHWAWLHRKTGNFALDRPTLRLGGGEALIELARAEGRLVPLSFTATGGVHVVDDAGSSVDLVDATYGREALVRTNTPMAVSARLSGVDVRYRATSAIWDPIAGHITLDEVTASYARTDASIEVTAARLDVDDQWQRARFTNATWRSHLTRGCTQLLISKPHGGDLFKPDGGTVSFEEGSSSVRCLDTTDSPASPE